MSCEIPLALGFDVAGQKKERKREAIAKIEAERSTVAKLADDYFNVRILGHWKHPNIVRSRIERDIKPAIGKLPLDQVRPSHIDAMLKGIVERGAPTIANDVLNWVKRMFNDAVKRELVLNNPAAAFDRSDADVPRPSSRSSRRAPFSAPVYDADQMAKIIREYMGRAAAKLRQQNGVAGVIGVWIETNRFREQESQHAGSRTIAFPMATDDTGVLTTWAVALMRRVFRPRHRYWKSGVTLLDLSPKGAEQLSLFDAPTPLVENRRSEVVRVMDQANSKWGRGTIGIGSAGLQGSRAWSMKRELLSPRYTTRWNELPKVRA